MADRVAEPDAQNKRPGYFLLVVGTIFRFRYLIRLFGIILTTYFDLLTHILVIIQYSSEAFWSSLMIGFGLLVPVTLSIRYSFHYMQGHLTFREVAFHVCLSLLHLEPMYAAFDVVKRGDLSAAAFRKTDYIPGTDSFRTVPIYFLNLLKALMESLPSAILQTYIVLLEPGSATPALFTSLLASWGSITISLSVYRYENTKYGRFGALLRRDEFVGQLVLFLFSGVEVACRIAAFAMVGVAVKGAIYIFFAGLFALSCSLSACCTALFSEPPAHASPAEAAAWATKRPGIGWFAIGVSNMFVFNAPRNRSARLETVRRRCMAVVVLLAVAGSFGLPLLRDAAPGSQFLSASLVRGNITLGVCPAGVSSSSTYRCLSTRDTIMLLPGYSANGLPDNSSVVAAMDAAVVAARVYTKVLHTGVGNVTAAAAAAAATASVAFGDCAISPQTNTPHQIFCFPLWVRHVAIVLFSLFLLLYVALELFFFQVPQERTELSVILQGVPPVPLPPWCAPATAVPEAASSRTIDVIAEAESARPLNSSVKVGAAEVGGSAALPIGRSNSLLRLFDSLPEAPALEPQEQGSQSLGRPNSLLRLFDSTESAATALESKTGEGDALPMARTSSLLRLFDSAEALPAGATAIEPAVAVANMNGESGYIDSDIRRISLEWFKSDENSRADTTVAIGGLFLQELRQLMQKTPRLKYYFNERGHLPLHEAVVRGLPEEAVRCILVGASDTLLLKTEDGDTPLALAIKHGHRHLIPLLLGAVTVADSEDDEEENAGCCSLRSLTSLCDCNCCLRADSALRGAIGLVGGQAKTMHSLAMLEGQRNMLPLHLLLYNPLSYTPQVCALIARAYSEAITIPNPQMRSCKAVVTTDQHAITAVYRHAVTGACITGGEDFQLKLWKGHRTTPVAVQRLESPPRRLVMFPDHNYFVALSNSAVCEVRSIADGLAVVCELRGHTDAVTCAAVLPCGARLITGSRDKSIRLWSVSDGQCLATLRGHSSAVIAVVCLPVHSLAAESVPQQSSAEAGTPFVHGVFVSADGDGNIKVWDLSESADPLCHTLSRSNPTGTAAPGHNSCSSLYCRLEKKAQRHTLSVRSSSIHHLPELLQQEAGPVQPVTCMLLRWHERASQRYLMTGHPRQIKLWSLESLFSGRVRKKHPPFVLSRLRGHTSAVTQMALLPDGDRLMSLSENHTVKMWSLENRFCITTQESTASFRPTALAAVQSACAVVCAGYNSYTRRNDVKIWGELTGISLAPSAAPSVGPSVV